MNFEIKQKIFNKIKEYDRIMLFRHIRIDGDCTGATKGLKALISETWPEKEVYIIDGEHSDFLEFTGKDDEEIPDEDYKSALAIVLDTATESRISNQKFKLCREIIKIDHHIPVDNYGDYQWVEEERSSCSEMIVDFYLSFKDEFKMSQSAATHLYMGIVTDSGRFKYRGVNGDTLRCAGALLDQNINTELLYAHLYLEPYETLKFRSAVYEKMQMTDEGVAYIYIDRAMREQFGISIDEAAACVNLLDSIIGCLCWIAFIETDAEDGSIRVRMRSRFVSINTVAEKYHGGGHACASGATVYSKEEAQMLIKDASEAVKSYKATNEGWL